MVSEYKRYDTAKGLFRIMEEEFYGGASQQNHTNGKNSGLYC